MMNPILERELKSRMRTVKTPIILTLYLLLMGFIVFVFFSSTYGFNPRIAVSVYQVIAIAQYVMLMMMIPALTAIAISGERERQTLDLLLVSDFSPWKIIVGKIASALVFILLMMIATLPFMAIVFLFGGISLLDILGLIGFFVLSAGMVSCIGLVCSVAFKRNITAIVVSYLLTGWIFVGNVAAFGVTVSLLYAFGGDYQNIEKFFEPLYRFFLAGNPFIGFLDLAGQSLYMLTGVQSTSGMPLWALNVLFMMAVSVFCLLISRRKLAKKP